MTTPIELIINGKDNTKGAFNSAASNISRIGQIAAGILTSQVFTAIARQIKDFAVSAVKEAREAALVNADLEAVLKSTGGVAGVTASMVDELSTKISENSKYTDEAIKSADVLLLTFTSIGKDVFPQATQAVADMSARFKQDLSASAIQLGKALNDPIQGVGALSRIGIQFTKDQEEMIKKMVETGDIAGAQGIILEEVGKQTKGAAESQVTAWEKVTKKVDNIKEKIATALLPTLDKLGVGLLQALDDPRVQKAIDKLTEWIETTSPAALEKLSGFFDSLRGKGFAELTQMFEDAVTNVNWEGLSQKIVDWIQSIDWIGMGYNIAAGLGNIGESVREIITRIDWKGIFSALGIAFLEVIMSLGVTIGQAWEPAVQQIGMTIELLKGIVAMKMDEIRSAISLKIASWIAVIGAKISQFRAVGVAIVNGLKAGISAAWGGLVSYAVELVNGLVASTKDALEIKSPSRVFYKIGGYITQGLAGGIGSGMQNATGAMSATTRRLQQVTNQNTYNRSAQYNFAPTYNMNRGSTLSEAFG